MPTKQDARRQVREHCGFGVQLRYRWHRFWFATGRLPKPQHACPHCRNTGEVYRQLTTELRDQPIEVEQFDLSQSAEREAVSQRLQKLGLGSLIEGRNEAAFLALVDSDGKPIREFKPSMQSERIAKEVLELVTQQASRL